ncbi:MAG: aspartate-semialdehyde dehydrogenase [Candidatus Baltobacteraceae bacterium]
MKLAVVGATGLVGATILRVLAERRVSLDELGAFASRDRTETVEFGGRAWPVRRAGAQALRGYDAVLFASSEDASAELAEACVASGAVAIDNSATFRLRDDVPLIVPEINADALRPEHRLFPVANCTAIVLTMGLAPIATVAGLRSVRVASYQAVSGAGRAGLDELDAGERALASGAPEPAPCTFVAPIARNVVPQIGAFDAAGDSGEERKLVAETRKILGLPDLHVAATTVRVPVRTAHAAVAFVETARVTSVDELGAAFTDRPGLQFHREGIVTPRDVEGTDDVHVARLRSEDGDDGRHFQFWVVGDQLRKGAATNAVQILELLIARGLVGLRAVGVP